MKINVFICVLLGGLTLSENAKIANSSQLRSKNIFKSNINNIIEDILFYQWKDGESTCVQKILDFLRNVQNQTLWATWVWDSMQSPTGVLFGSRNQLGNYQQCIHPPWITTRPELRTQYCLADIVLTDKRTNLNEDPYSAADSYVSSVTKLKLTVNELRWGLCLPAVCKPNSVKKFAETLLGNSHLAFALPEASIHIISCQSYNDHSEPSYGYYATIAFMVSLVLITLISTFYYENHHHDDDKENLALQLAKAFSIKKNSAEFFKEKDEEIRCLNSMKFMTACGVLYFHSFFISTNIGFSNIKQFIQFAEKNNLIIVASADTIVDTCFMTSGILLVKGLSANDKPINPFKIVIKRYMRLIYLTMVIILFMTQVLKHHCTGPLMAKTTAFEIETCEVNWWTNLLAINNYMDFSRTCLPVTWHTACDFHFTIFGTGLFLLYQKNKSLGLKALLISAVAPVILRTFIAYQQGLSPIHFDDMEKYRDIRKLANTPTYIQSHWRSGPYFIGMAFGFLLSAYKPADYKKLSKIYSTILFTVGLGLASLTIIFGGYILIHRQYNTIKTALYAGANRSIWAISIGLIVLSCEYGTVPLVSDVLNWRVFGPLSKLCYGLYLTHWPLQIAKTSITLSPVVANFTCTVIDSLSELMFCCGVAYLLWLVFEAPMNNIVAIVLQTRSSKTMKETIKENNERTRQTTVSMNLKKIS